MMIPGGFNLREEILNEHSKAQCDKIVKWVGTDQKRFDELFHLFLHDEYRVTQRAAWPLSYSVSAHPDFIKKRLGELIKNLHKPGTAFMMPSREIPSVFCRKLKYPKDTSAK